MSGMPSAWRSCICIEVQVASAKLHASGCHMHQAVIGCSTAASVPSTCDSHGPPGAWKATVERQKRMAGTTNAQKAAPEKQDSWADLPAEEAPGSLPFWQLRWVSVISHRIIQMMQHAQELACIWTPSQVLLACRFFVMQAYSLRRFCNNSNTTLAVQECEHPTQSTCTGTGCTDDRSHHKQSRLLQHATH